MISISFIFYSPSKINALFIKIAPAFALFFPQYHHDNENSSAFGSRKAATLEKTGGFIKNKWITIVGNKKNQSTV
jgi:hypothetical protein